MMSQSFILLGTNVGNRLQNLNEACNVIGREAGKIITTSSIYKTQAWGHTEQPDFYNQVLKIETSLSPQDLLQTLLSIEKMFGRVRNEKWGPRTLDLDILFYENEVIHTTDLIIPHPGIPFRRFTLIPLEEIAPDLMHPVFQKSITHLLQECPDSLTVNKIAT